MKTPPPPAYYLRPHLPESRVRQTWSRILPRLPGAKKPAMPFVWAMAPAATLACGIAVVLAIFFRGSTPQLPTGGDITITSEAQPRSFELASAHIELQPYSVVTVAPGAPFEQRLGVKRGSARFNVVHKPTRRFVVTAGAVEVDDIGTEFTVALEGASAEVVRVAVTSGEVLVRVDSRAHPLRAGETFTTQARTVATAAEPAAPPPGSASIADLPLGAGSAGGVPPAAPSEAPVATSEGKPASVSADPVTAKSLLADAMAARGAGDAPAEANALDAIRRKFPRDPRAAIAAFELGIVRMDKLGNRSGALEALRSAVASAPGASFRQDAEARIIRLLDDTRDVAGCRAARDAFLLRYPSSVHRDTVRRHCPP